LGAAAGIASIKLSFVLDASTPLIEGAARVLRQARKLPIGKARNELRHLARIMIKLHRIGFRANISIFKKPTIH